MARSSLSRPSATVTVLVVAVALVALLLPMVHAAIFNTGILEADVTMVNGFCAALDQTGTAQYMGACSSKGQFTALNSSLRLNMHSLQTITSSVTATTAPYLAAGSTPLYTFDQGAQFKTQKRTTPYASSSWAAGTAYDRLDTMYNFGNTDATRTGNADFASYLCTAGEITFNDNHFDYYHGNASFIGNADAAYIFTDNFCIVEGKNNETGCPATQRTAVPGTLKWSVFINSVGDNWANPLTGTEKHFALRLETVIDNSLCVYFNGDTSLTHLTVGERDITRSTFVIPGMDDFTIDFRNSLTYNTGPLIADKFATREANDVITGGSGESKDLRSTSKNVHVKFKFGSPSYIDIIFGDELKDKNTFVVYDPEVALADGSSSSGSSSSSSLGAGVWIGIAVGAAVLVALLAFVAIRMRRTNLSVASAGYE